MSGRWTRRKGILFWTKADITRESQLDIPRGYRSEEQIDVLHKGEKGEGEDIKENESKKKKYGSFITSLRGLMS